MATSPTVETTPPPAQVKAGEVELRDIHGPVSGRQKGVIGRQIAMRTVAAGRAFDEIRLVETQRRKEVLPERLAESQACHLLDDEPQNEVVAAVVRPSLARREQSRFLQSEVELFPVPDHVSMRGVAAVRLEERDRIGVCIVEAARVVQKLADRDAGSEGRSVSVEVEQALVDELEDKRSHEDLRDASDAETVARCQRLARANVGEPRRCLDSLGRFDRNDDGARNAGRDDSLELILNGFHDRPGDPNPLGSVSHQERSRGPAPELARQPA